MTDYELSLRYQCVCLFYDLRQKGMMIENSDIMIGATAIVNDMVLVTENVKHLGRLNGISIETW